MARPCPVCTSTKRHELERELLLGTTSVRELAKRSGIHRDRLARHRDDHLTPALRAQLEAEQAEHGRSVLDELEELHEATLQVLRSAGAGRWLGDEEKLPGDALVGEDGRVRLPDTVLKAVREARSNLELRARLEGELTDTSQLVVQVEYVGDWRTGTGS